MVIDIQKELGQNFIDFSYEANSARAFADARDGLKPGQRACLWEMFNSGYTSKKPHVKSAKIAGAVTGNWWPHGDVAIYETFARMSQPWINNIPEVSWHGNNGSQYTGPECASSRYTEARLSSIVEEGMFCGIKKNNVKMISNYSEDAEWPEVLPAIFPRLLVNGCQGIGSTIANTWLPHNLVEISEILKSYIDGEEINYKNIFPSFPSGGIIINKNDIHSIYETGKGKVILRGRAEIKNKKILITELPYQVYVQPYVEEITEMAIKDELDGIESICNKSGKNKLLIEIECSIEPERVLKQLYKKTNLQKNYNANQWALVGKTPKLLTLKDYCQIYVNHNVDCLIKELNFDLDKAKARLHIVEGLLIALEDIDNVITLIKKSSSSAAAKDALIEKYHLDEAQAKAILAMRLSSLAHMEKVELENEKKELVEKIDDINSILVDKAKQLSIIKDRLVNIVRKYGDTRRTEITNIEVSKEEKEIEEVVPEDCVVILSQAGEIKRVPSKSFKVQKRNGKGVKTESDAILDTISTNTVDTLMVFTNKGKMYRLLVDTVPIGTNTSKGVRIGTLINMEPNETVIAITSLYRKSEAKYVIFITKNGLLKKTALEEYLKVKRSTGIAAINLKEGDTIANVTFAKEEEFIVVTKQGMAIHFSTKEIAPIGRVAAGVKTIKLSDGDEVITGIPIHKETDSLSIFSSNGYGKKVKIDEIPIQGRAGKGVCVYKPTQVTGEVSGVAMIDDTDNLLLIGKPNSICISAVEVPLISRSGFGNIMIKGSFINKIIKI